MPRRQRRARYQQLSPFERARIIGLCEAGLSLRTVAARVGRQASTVQRVWQQWSNEGTHTRRPGTGPARQTTVREDRRIIRMARMEPHATAAQIRAAVAPHVTQQTVGNRLRAAGLRSRVPAEGVPLTPQQRRVRLAWCRERSTWVDEWHRVVFSDESRFCLARSDRRNRVRRRTGERGRPDLIVERHTGPTPSIMVWGAIGFNVKSQLVLVEGTMTARQYVDRVLNPVVVPMMANIANGMFQQDNARVHIARISREALHDITTLEWPTRSPDLSPIEHVWDMMGRQLANRPQPPTTLEQLTRAVQQAWATIPQEAIQGLIDSMPRRIHQCIAARGGHILY